MRPTSNRSDDRAGAASASAAGGERGGPPEDRTSGDASLIDWVLIGNYLGFAGRSVRRHKALFLVSWLGVVAGVAGLLVVLPKTYQVTVVLQAQRNQVIAALSNPGRSTALADDTPTRQAAETVMRRDALIALVKQTDLVRELPLRRAPAARLKNYLTELFLRPATEEEAIEGTVDYLEKQLWVTVGDGTVTIGANLPDPELTYRVVEAAHQNFLEARHAVEVASIGEAVSILESRKEDSNKNLEASVKRLQTLRAARAAKYGARPRPMPEVRLTAPVDPETMQLILQVQTQRRAVGDLEEFRRRRVTELQTRLQELQAVYSPGHPMVVDVEQSLEALRKDSPQLASLREQLAPLEAELARRGIPVDPRGQGQARQAATTFQVPQLGLDEREMEDPEVEYAKSQVRVEFARYQSILDRIESARLELDTTRAAFKYRYSVIRPAQRPKGPIKPKAAMVLLASLIGGLLPALLAAVLRDLQSGRVLEAWQAEQALHVPILARFPPR